MGRIISGIRVSGEGQVGQVGQDLKDIGAPPSHDARLEQRVSDALRSVPGGEEAARYFLKGGQPSEEAKVIDQGLRELLDPRTAQQGFEKLKQAADACPVDPEVLRGLMGYSGRRGEE